MRIKALSPLILSTLFVSACGTTPPASLVQARDEVGQISQNATVSAHAPQDVKAATESLRRAEQAWEEDEDEDTVNHLAHLSAQQARIARERALMKEAEKQIETATAERDRVRLEARTAEADMARQQAAAAQQQARQAQTQARDARQLAALAQANQQDAQARNADLEAQLKALRGQTTDRGTVITLGDVLFDSGKARLKPGSRRQMQQLANALKNSGGRRVLIEGHTDSRGSDQMNQALSEARANAVRDAMIELGVDQGQVSTAGYGERFPIASNNTPAGRQLNRRVDIIIGRDDQAVQPRASDESSGSTGDSGGSTGTGNSTP